MKINRTEIPEILSYLIHVLENGKLPKAQDLQQLKREIIKDRVVSKAEADTLFSLKNDYPEIKQITDFLDIFVEGITSYLLYTGMTDGSLDELEYIWLKDSISKNNEFDEYEKSLLKNLIDRAESVPQNFHTLLKNFK